MNTEIRTNPLLVYDPVSGAPLHVSELRSDETGIAISGRFEIPRLARLSSEHVSFLETFLRCRGVLSQVEKELSLSYPTVRARLDALLGALDLTPVKEDAARRVKFEEEKKLIIDQLERGEITAAEAKNKLREIQ